MIDIKQLAIELGQRIRETRKLQGISVLGLARMTGLNRNTITELELGCGKKCTTTLLTLVAISNALDYPLAEMLGDY